MLKSDKLYFFQILKEKFNHEPIKFDTTDVSKFLEITGQDYLIENFNQQGIKGSEFLVLNSLNSKDLNSNYQIEGLIN